MPEGIKYDPSGSPPSGATKIGNFIINPDPPGPSSTTGYWSTLSSGTGGYSIYINKVSQGPSIYIAANNTQLISLTNHIANQNYSTAFQCITYFAGQSDQILIAGPASPILDQVGNSAIGLSLRKVRAAYSGSAIRVRRASDNTEQDIGFTSSGALDTSSLNSFCSGTDGFIRTWYDQTGNGRDAAQTTSASQPQIYKSATGIVTQNGLPIIEFTTTRNLTGTYAVNGLTTMNITIVGRGTGSGNQASNRGAIFWTESGSWGSVYFGVNQDFALGRFGTGQSNNNIGGSVGSTTALRYWSMIKDGSTEYVYLNNALVTNPIGKNTTIANTNSTYTLNYNSYGCFLSEVLVWPSTELSDLTTLNLNLAAYYRI